MAPTPPPPDIEPAAPDPLLPGDRPWVPAEWLEAHGRREWRQGFGVGVLFGVAALNGVLALAHLLR